MSASDLPAITLILTVKDEAATLPPFFESLDAQSLQPSEVILVDGGSSDDTLDVARSWKTSLPFIIVSEPDANISRGRNIALRRATGSIVAVTDAGTRLRLDWLERLVEPFQRPVSQQPDVVAGFFEAECANTFELALAATTLPDIDEIRPEHFLPSSRSVAFRRSLFEVGIEYPEWLDYCEDLVFDLKLKRADARFEFAPGAVVEFAPRPSARSHWRQYYRYARGDGQAGLFARRHAARYGCYFLILPWALLRRDRLAALVLAAGGSWYLARPIRRLWRRRDSVASSDLVRAGAMIPVLRILGDIAKMAGYPVGLWWRLRSYGLRRNWRSIREPGSSP
ncbi:MAG: glycosyltransferase [Nitrolancea sp.]